jgi:carbamate kinase
MGPKLKAACDFAETGRFAGIGRLQDARLILDGAAGTQVVRLDRVLA